MDFGVDRLVDMIEDRFGRRTANWLLTLVMLAVGATCINLIYKFVISPVTWAVMGTLRHVSSGDITVSRWQIISWLVGSCVSVFLLAIYWIVARYIVNRLKRQSDAIVAEAADLSAQLKTQSEEVSALADSVAKHQHRIEIFLDFIEPTLTENGLDIERIKKMLSSESSTDA